MSAVTLNRKKEYLTMTSTTIQDLEKRYSAAHKAAVGKAAGHLAMSKSAHSKGMDRLAKCAGAMVEAKKLGKAADPETLAGHIAAAHGHFSSAADHMDDAEAHLGKAASSFEDTNVAGSMKHPGLSELTEGNVPQYTADAPYGEKVAKVLKDLADGKLLTEEQVTKMVAVAAEKAALEAQNAALKNQVELLSKLPTAAPNVKIFDVTKMSLPGDESDGGGDKTARMGKLIDGVDFNIKDEGGFTKAAGTMISNMIKNGPKFGKTDFGKPPMWDPSFRGRGGTGARN